MRCSSAQNSTCPVLLTINPKCGCNAVQNPNPGVEKWSGFGFPSRHYDMHKFNFSNRIIPIWNSLPDYVVASPTINTFKARLDKLCENQDVRYNWKADISFIGSRSKVDLTID